MTYKAAITGLNFGGGTAVIIGDSSKQKNELLFRTFGKFIDSLNGRYITAEDVGTTVEDMEFVRMETPFVTGVSKALGGSGDPSPVTAYGVYVGMQACANEIWGSDSLSDKNIMVQGAGQVAKHLCEYLKNAGANIFISDIVEEKITNILKSVKAEVIKPEEIFEVEADIFSPCALGGIINDDTISKLKCEIIAGSANNQLEDEVRHSEQLMAKGILYAPDYVINAGGLINVSNEIEGYRQDRALRQADRIYGNVKNVIQISKEQNIPTHMASNKIAEDRLTQLGAIKKIYMSS
jgi:leucine dehydrogenase